MLVLTRREQDRILFPTLGISVEIMKLSRSRVSVGVVAPEGVRVIRHELMGPGESFDASALSSSEFLRSALREVHESLLQGNADDALSMIEHVLQTDASESMQTRSSGFGGKDVGRSRAGAAGLGQRAANAKASSKDRKRSAERIRESVADYQVLTPLNVQGDNRATLHIRSMLPFECIARDLPVDRHRMKAHSERVAASTG